MPAKKDNGFRNFVIAVGLAAGLHVCNYFRPFVPTQTTTPFAEIDLTDLRARVLAHNWSVI